MMKRSSEGNKNDKIQILKIKSINSCVLFYLDSEAIFLRNSIYLLLIGLLGLF